jgi:hypothetical protein
MYLNLKSTSDYGYLLMFQHKGLAHFDFCVHKRCTNTADSNYICINIENLNPKNGVLSSEALFNCKPTINIQLMFANSKIAAIGLGYGFATG